MVKIGIMDSKSSGAIVDEVVVAVVVTTVIVTEAVPCSMEDR